jgi:hypothetical protein
MRIFLTGATGVIGLCIVGVFGSRLHFVGAAFRRGALPTIL